MSTSLSSLSKFDQIQMPSGTLYRFTDQDLREMVIAVSYATGVAYTTNQLIYFATNDALYRVTADISAENNHAFTDLQTAETTITGEIERRYNEIKSIISNSIHYIGYTTTPLIDGATTNPITVNGQSYTAVSGDLVVYKITGYEYQINTGYAKDSLIVNNDVVYRVLEAITAQENTSFSAIESKLIQIAENGKEFIFSGTIWNEFGSTGILKALAFADTASGQYTAPTGSGTTTIKKYTLSGGNSSAGEQGVTDVSYVESVVGGTFNTNAIKDAQLGGTTEFNTDAIKDVSITDNGAEGIEVATGAVSGDSTFALEGVKVSVEGSCLKIETANTGSFTLGKKKLGVSKTNASKASVTISTTPADTGAVSSVTKHIHFTESTETAQVTVGTTTQTVTVTPDN